MKRRYFFQGALAVPLALSSYRFRAATEGEAKYIDPHVHIWTDDFKKYPLASGTTRADMELPHFLPEQILNHARPSGVNRVVLVQMSYYGTDNSYMLDMIAQNPTIFRGIAIIDPNAPNLGRAMADLKSKGIRGFRVPLVDQAGEAALRSGKLDVLFRTAGIERLAVCPLINPDYLEALAVICDRFPQTPVVIDHLGRIGMSGRIDEYQVRNLCALARFSQVRVKVSAFYALGEKRPPHLDLRDLIRRVHYAFGSRRLMWASDCPFQILREPYEASVGLIRDRLDFLSAEDKEWLLRRTAEELFFS